MERTITLRRFSVRALCSRGKIRIRGLVRSEGTFVDNTVCETVPQEAE